MKKFQQTLYVTFSITIILALSACAITHRFFSAGKIRSVYEGADFDVELLYTVNEGLIKDEDDPSGVYYDLTFSEIPDVDTAYLVKKEGNSALVVVFGVPGDRINITAITGDGYSEGNSNVIICRFRVNGTKVTTETEGLNLQSPEIIALYSPLKSATPDQTDFGLFG